MIPAREDRVSRANVLARAAWTLVRLTLFRPTPRPLHAWRRALLRLFGARIGRSVRVYQSARVWAPWNLEMADGSCLGDDVDCYNVARVRLGPGAVVSQYCFLCTAGHDSRRAALPLVSAPIDVGARAWLTADVFVGPGVSIGEGAVVTVRSVATRDVPPWTIATGHPAVAVRARELIDDRAPAPPARAQPSVPDADRAGRPDA